MRSRPVATVTFVRGVFKLPMEPDMLITIVNCLNGILILVFVLIEWVLVIRVVFILILLRFLFILQCLGFSLVAKPADIILQLQGIINSQSLSGII